MSSYKGFTTVQLDKPARSMFDLSHEKRITTRMGRLTPCFFMETIPNDTVKCNTEVMLRLAPLLAPIMHRVNVFVHFFFVPNRLLWKDWELFITNGRLGTETPPVPPNALVTVIQGRGVDGMDIKSPADYLGLGTITDVAAGYASVTLDLMPNAAFYKVWYDYYRDRNYVADNTILPLLSGALSDGPSIDVLFVNKTRDYQKDYFTSALPWTQRGNEVLMPLIGSGTVTSITVAGNAGKLRRADTGAQMAGVLETTATANPTTVGISSGGLVGQDVFYDPNGTLNANLTTSGVSINDLRRSLQLQTWLERNALAGSRYNESIWAHFNRRTSDGRLQRAEYLGGGKVTVKISEVVTTAWSQDGAAEDVPPANMAGHGLSFGNTNRFSYNCEEHGFIIGVLSVMPNTAYMQGSARMFFNRNTFLDYPWPSFAHLGEQPVYKYELFQEVANTPAVRSTQPVFGYQSRYSDWKYIPSSSHGDFKTSLDFWHLSRKFASSPTLGSTFCTFEDALQNRVFAVSGEDTLWCYLYNNCSVVRSLPYYGTPKLV